MRKLLLIGVICSLCGCSNSNRASPDLNMVISVSSDGHYAIATNTNKQAVLWDLQNHSYKIIFKDANIYSAYFIKSSSDFMYQNDKTNEVIIENVNGQIVKTFNPGFPTYGEIITPDLSSYYAVDQNDQVFKIHDHQSTQFLWHYCDQNDPAIPQGVPYTCGSFPGDGKLFNLNLSFDNHYLVTSGAGEFFIWDAQSGKMIQHIEKNDAQTVAAINPDGAYVVTGDIMQRAVYYNLKTQQRKGFFYNMPPRPEAAAYYGRGNYPQEILAIKFIDNNVLLVFAHGYSLPFYYAAVFNPINLKPIKNPPENSPYLYDLYPAQYLPLTDDQNFYTDPTMPLVSDEFSRDEAIDTSPSAHILVMSQEGANGIIVYKYDPSSQTLTRVWTGTVKPWWNF